jgi:hypothetical protein
MSAHLADNMFLCCLQEEFGTLKCFVDAHPHLFDTAWNGESSTEFWISLVHYSSTSDVQPSNGSNLVVPSIPLPGSGRGGRGGRG